MLTVRPSTRLIRLSYWLWILAAAGILIWGQLADVRISWAALVPAALLAAGAVRHLATRFTLLTVDGEKLRFETGLLSKSTRTMEIYKVQDVRVDQSLGQRMIGTGDVSIETAGESSRLTIHRIDNPQRVADAILSLCRNSRAKGQAG